MPVYLHPEHLSEPKQACVPAELGPELCGVHGFGEVHPGLEGAALEMGSSLETRASGVASGRSPNLGPPVTARYDAFQKLTVGDLWEKIRDAADALHANPEELALALNHSHSHPNCTPQTVPISESFSLVMGAMWKQRSICRRPPSSTRCFPRIRAPESDLKSSQDRNP